MWVVFFNQPLRSSPPQDQKGVSPIEAVADVTLASFQKDVLDASKANIVLLDFWAPWCGPCMALSPTLEKIAKESKGKVRLAKVNLDQNKQLAQSLRVQSIPTVYIFAQGQPVDAFSGNLPEDKIKEILQPIYKTMKFVDDSAFDALVTSAKQQFDIGEYARAASDFKKALTLKPHDPECLAGMAHCYIFLGQAVEAKSLAQKVDTTLQNQTIASLRHHIKLIEDIQHELASTTKIQTVGGTESENIYETSLKKILTVHIDAAIDNLLTLIEKKHTAARAKMMLIRLFDALGSSHHLTVSGRKRLGTLLFL